ncbi:DUF945 family protein [Pelovirga terrestris]|uniref:DUF945 family protein n=1 Tax=Pelovirga terrestris TaxID=2771352 RepID=A0A8J6QYP0_9BACT|nr:DUF945 family protein [Pelovirga terrestris]MBD1400797.1 DUF945 family protein [Pelovirga terrestris]
MWKKLLTPTLVITLVTLFSLTWYGSIKAEEYFALWVERSNHYAPLNTTNELVSYERRFFTAEAITTVNISDLGRYDLHHLIRHYAWGVTMITTPLADSATSSLLEGLRIVTDVGPTGSARSRLSLPRLAVETADGTTITIDRIGGEGHVNAAATQGSWDVSLEQIQIVLDRDNQLVVAGINNAGEMDNLDQFPLGQSRTRINSLALQSVDGPPFIINGLHIDWANHIGPEPFYLALSDISFAGLQTGGSAFTDGRLVFKLLDLDTRVIEALMTARNSFRQHIRSANDSNDSFIDDAILPVYHALLQSGATLELENLSLATTGGQLSGVGRATLKPGTTQTAPGALLEQIDSELQLDFDVVILARLGQLAEQIQGKTTNISVKEEELRMIFGGLAQLGFLSRLEGERFRLRVAYDQGEIKLNDQPFRLF